MVHPDQMQDAVDQEIPQLGAQRDPPGTSLPGRAIERNHDIAETGSPKGCIGTVEHGERQHIGRTARSAEAAG